jgi:hypothetical protein
MSRKKTITSADLAHWARYLRSLHVGTTAKPGGEPGERTITIGRQNPVGDDLGYPGTGYTITEARTVAVESAQVGHLSLRYPDGRTLTVTSPPVVRGSRAVEAARDAVALLADKLDAEAAQLDADREFERLAALVQDIDQARTLADEEVAKRVAEEADTDVLTSSDEEETRSWPNVVVPPIGPVWAPRRPFSFDHVEAVRDESRGTKSDGSVAYIVSRWTIHPAGIQLVRAVTVWSLPNQEIDQNGEMHDASILSSYEPVEDAASALWELDDYTPGPIVPDAQGNAWRRHNEFGGVVESVPPNKMAELVRRTAELDAKGQRWDEGDWGWRYEYDPSYNRVTEAVWAETNQLGRTSGRYYTRPKTEEAVRAWDAVNPVTPSVQTRKSWVPPVTSVAEPENPEGHGYTWQDVKDRPASELTVGSVFVNPSVGTAYRSAPDGTAQGAGPLPFLDGEAWTVTAVEGRRITARSHTGRELSGEYGDNTKVLLVVPKAPQSDDEAITRELDRVAREGGHISDACARTIAAGWQAASNPAITSFASTGAIHASDIDLDLLEEVNREIVTASLNGQYSIAERQKILTELGALRSYVQTSPGDEGRGPVAGWSSVWVR